MSFNYRKKKEEVCNTHGTLVICGSSPQIWYIYGYYDRYRKIWALITEKILATPMPPFLLSCIFY